MLCLLFAAALAAMPAFSGGGDGGGQSGGSTVNSANIGITILPAPLACVSGPLPEIPRATYTFTGTADIVLGLGEGMGPATATITDELTSRAISLPVAGRAVTIDRQILAQFVTSGVRNADVLIVDAEGRGYRIRVILEANGTGSMLVY
jgi:hypothetical protein